MEQYLIERGTLAKIVDMLISQKYPGETPVNINTIREDGIHSLDNVISDKIFGSLNTEQMKEINKIFDDQEEDPTVFRDFFKKAGVNLDQKINEAVQEFSADFLGGENGR